MKFHFTARVLKYLPKNDTSFAQFFEVSALFNRMLELGWDDLVAANKKLFFEEFEFEQPFMIEKANEMEKLVPSKTGVIRKSGDRLLIDRIANKLGL